MNSNLNQATVHVPAFDIVYSGISFIAGSFTGTISSSENMSIATNNPGSMLYVNTSGQLLTFMPSFVAFETFEEHVQDRKGKVLVWYNKLENNERSVLPLTRALDLIYRFACTSPFTRRPMSTPIPVRLFEFNDEEIELCFEDPRDVLEAIDALTLSDKQLKEYYAHKIKDMEYNTINI